MEIGDVIYVRQSSDVYKAIVIFIGNGRYRSVVVRPFGWLRRMRAVDADDILGVDVSASEKKIDDLMEAARKG